MEEALCTCAVHSSRMVSPRVSVWIIALAISASVQAHFVWSGFSRRVALSRFALDRPLTPRLPALGDAHRILACRSFSLACVARSGDMVAHETGKGSIYPD